MKDKIILLLSISIMLQSCYSYKTINLNSENLVVGKIYKIQQNRKLEKVKLKSITDSSIVVKKGNIESKIAISDIRKIKKRKFSATKTVLLVTTLTVASVVGAFIATFNPVKNLGPIQSPP